MSETETRAVIDASAAGQSRAIAYWRREARTPPLYWEHLAEHDSVNCAWYRHRSLGVAVCVSTAVYGDDVWLHVSYSRRSRMPDYEDGVMVKRDFIGIDREAYAVFPPVERHVSIHLYCLHFWCNLDHPDGVLPDFRAGGEI